MMENNNLENRQVSLEELGEAQRRGDNAFLSKVHVSGTVLIKDKDGNVKNTMEITSIEVQEDERNANS